jgi:hypothetical protein
MLLNTSGTCCNLRDKDDDTDTKAPILYTALPLQACRSILEHFGCPMLHLTSEMLMHLTSGARPLVAHEAHAMKSVCNVRE